MANIDASHLRTLPTAINTPPNYMLLRRGLLGLCLALFTGLIVWAIWLHAQGCGQHTGISAFMLWSSLMFATGFAVLGALIIQQRKHDRMGFLCCWIALTSGVTIVSIMGLSCGVEAAEPWVGLPYVAWFHYAFSPIYGIVPQVILLPLLYPTGRFVSRRWAWATAAGLVLLTICATALGFMPDFRLPNGVTFALDLANPFGVANPPAWWHPVFMTSSVILECALCFLGMASVVVRFRRSEGDERQQLKWLAYFLVTVVGVQLLVFELPGNIFYPEIFFTIWYELIIFAMQLGFPLVIGVAIFKYRLYDIDLIINRTVVYGALTAFVVALYALIVTGLSRIFHDENNFIASLVATGAIAILFQPVRIWLQGNVNRWLYGERDDPAGVLTRLTDEMEAANSGATLLSSLVVTIATSLKLPYVAVWIRDANGSDALAAEYGTHMNQVESLPLMHQQEIIGRLELAPRSPRETLSAAERPLLVAIARLIATTARMIQLTDEVQGARVRTVSAREEERRRLRRDLHDGLGPVLASQGLKLAAARQLLRVQPETAERLLDEVMHEGENTIGEVRRLVYALRPPTLDELGLVQAIREHIDTVSVAVPVQITLDAPKRLPEISAAIEVAAFRIVQEALSNVIRHAHAHHCMISLKINGNLELVVEDDGVGLSSTTRSGIGLLSMRERAAEVGGVCHIESSRISQPESDHRHGKSRGVTLTITFPLMN